jgi:hypothetical protein
MTIASTSAFTRFLALGFDVLDNPRDGKFSVMRNGKRATGNVTPSGMMQVNSSS